MPTVYVRRFNLKPSLSEDKVLDYWKFYLEEFCPAARQVEGVRSVKAYSGAGGLVADLRIISEMDNAGVYERLLVDPKTSKLNARGYASLDMTASTQLWLREITPELIQALTQSDVTNGGFQ